MLLPIDRIQRPPDCGGDALTRDRARRREPLRVTFPTADDYAREFDENLLHMGLFVPMSEDLPVRAQVEIVVVVPDGGPEIPGRGEVSYTVDTTDAAQHDTQPGVGLHLLEFDLDTAQRARDAIRESQTEAALQPPEQREAVRIPAPIRVRYCTREAFEEGLVRDISFGGVYLRTEEPFPLGTSVQLTFVRPLDGKEMVVDGEVARTPLVGNDQGPGIGMGIRFLPMSPGKRRELDRFVRYVGLRRRAGTAQEVRGRVQDTGMDSLVQLFCETDREGELVLRRGDEAGRIEFKESRIVRAELPSCGVQGKRALFRMMTWEDGEFEYHSRAVDEGAGFDRSGSQLLREGMRMRAEIGSWHRRIPEDRRIEVGPAIHDGRMMLPDGLRPVLESLLEAPTVSVALDRLGKTDVEAYRILGTLERRGIIRFRPAR